MIAPRHHKDYQMEVRTEDESKDEKKNPYKYCKDWMVPAKCVDYDGATTAARPAWSGTSFVFVLLPVTAFVFSREAA